MNIKKIPTPQGRADRLRVLLARRIIRHYNADPSKAPAWMWDTIAWLEVCSCVHTAGGGIRNWKSRREALDSLFEAANEILEDDRERK